MINIFLIFPQICKMDKNFQNIINIADELVAKSYQLQGCLSQMSKVPAEHTIFLNKTTDRIREIGKILKTEGQSLHGKVEKMQSNDRIALSKLKKENFTLKRKIEELETDQELSQLDESLFSSQESEKSNIAAAKDVCPDEKDSAKAPDDKLITSDSGKTADLNPSTSGSTSDNP